NAPGVAGGGADPSRPPMGVVALLMRPEARLFPLLIDNTVPTRTVETLLFRMDGPKPSYVSPLKGDSAGWSAIDRSLETLAPLARRAANGRDTFGEMLDYRAAPSFAATRWIVPPGWGLVVKVDREEALADFYQAGRLAGHRSFLESFLLLLDDAIGRGLEELVRAEGLGRRAREVMQTGQAQSDLPFDFYLPHRHETRPVRVTITSIRIEEQEDARLLLIVEDLSEEERLQAARKESEKRFQDLVQGLDAIVWEADAATLRFSFVSQRAQTVLGFPTGRW